MSTLTEPRTLVFPFSEVEWRDSGDPEKKDETTLRGHAAVFNSLSEDLGGFREKIEPGAFRAALRKQPDVRLLLNHDGLPLARTASGTLELREDTQGLHVFARLDKNDPDVISLRGKMRRGDVDQMSFAFTLRDDGDDWEVAEDETVIRTIRADGVDGLFDVSVVTYPAYRHTSVSMRSLLDDAIASGRLALPEAIALPSEEAQRDVEDSVWLVSAPGGLADSEVAEETPGEERDAAPVEGADIEVDVTQETDTIADLQVSVRATATAARESYLRLLAENGLA